MKMTYRAIADPRYSGVWTIQKLSSFGTWKEIDSRSGTEEEVRAYLLRLENPKVIYANGSDND